MPSSHAASAAQIRLAWTLQLGPHVIAILGTGNQDPLTANVAAEALRLTPEEMTPLDNFHRRGT
jgi:diketogulonate reductase-like aldo/keto reductase